MDKQAMMNAAGIPADWQPHCHVTQDGKIFTPRMDDGGNRLATGEEVYQSWLAAKDAPPETTPEERAAALDVLGAQVATLTLKLASLERGTEV